MDRTDSTTDSTDANSTNDANKSTDANSTNDATKSTARKKVITPGKNSSNSSQDAIDGVTTTEYMVTPEKETTIDVPTTKNSGEDRAEDNNMATNPNSTVKLSHSDTTMDVNTGGDRAENYITETNPGSTVKLSPTVLACLAWVSKRGKLVAENVNQAVPDQNKLNGLLTLASRGKSGNYNALNDSQMHLHLSKKPLANSGDVEEQVSWYHTKSFSVQFCEYRYMDPLLKSRLIEAAQFAKSISVQFYKY